MRYPTLLLSFVILLGPAAGAQQQAAAPPQQVVRDPQAVATVQQAVASLGGTSAFAAIQNASANGSLQGSGANATDTTNFVWEIAGNQFRYETQGSNGHVFLS